MNQQTKDFIKILEHLKPSRHSYEVFNDWLIMASAAFYSWKQDKSVEEEYLEVSKNYTSGELEKHSQLLAITVEALENIDTEFYGGDFLGEVFTYGELANSRNGQFFTPYHISHMMAEMSMGETEFPKSRVCKISDPCCGAGGMLIAGAMVMKKRGFDYQHDALFVGQDIDHRCARMTFIQLSLLAIPAVIICGDTLTMTHYWQRETIGYHLSGMDSRLRIEAFLEKLKGLETAAPVFETPETGPAGPEPKEPAIINLPPSRKYAQGELF
jgi:type I restriction-modification system DNA methylase subunit